MLLRLITNKKLLIKDNKLEILNFQEIKIIITANWYKEVVNITVKWVNRNSDRIFQNPSLDLRYSNCPNKSNQITMTWMKTWKHGWITELNYFMLGLSIRRTISFYPLNKWNKSRSSSSCFILIDCTPKRTNFLTINLKITILIRNPVKTVRSPKVTWFHMNKPKN